MPEPNARFRQNVRGFYMWLGSMVILGAAPLIARSLAEQESLGARIAAVVVGGGGSLPWMFLIFVIVRRGDEFFRRMHLIALSIAFFAALLVISTLAWLVKAGFVDDPDLFIVWGLLLVIWVIALLATKRHFERSR